MTGGEFIIRSRQLRALAMCDAFIAAIDKAKSIIHKETTMTNKEAVEVLDTLEISIGAKELREFGFKLTSNRLANLADAVKLAIAALREKADPEWIPNTGTKPECGNVYVRFRRGDIEHRIAEHLRWHKLGMNDDITHYIPIPAPPEFVEKRRYVVKIHDSNKRYGVWDQIDCVWFAYSISTVEAAQAIADIYEGVKP